MMLFATAVMSAWCLITTDGPKVCGHSTSSLTDTLYLFGGLKNGAGSPFTNELWKYDGSWSEMRSSVCPSPRMYAASALLDNNLFVFGGWDPRKQDASDAFKKDAWRFDLDDLSWERISDMPSSSSRLAACSVENMIVIQSREGTLVCDGEGEINIQETKGFAPTGLSLCCTASYLTDSVVLFGGATRTQQMSNRIYVLDTSKWTWRCLPMKGDVPEPRASACMAPIGDSSFVVYGGAGVSSNGYENGKSLIPYGDTYTLEISGDVAHWKRHEASTASTHPSSRVAASLDVLKSCAVIHGGWDPVSKSTFDETWMRAI